MSVQPMRRTDVPQLTTPPANGQHLAVPIAAQSRKSRCGAAQKVSRERRKVAHRCAEEERAEHDTFQ